MCHFIKIMTRIWDVDTKIVIILHNKEEPK